VHSLHGDILSLISPLVTVYFHAETTQEKCANYSQPVTVAQKTNSYTTDHVYSPEKEPQPELCFSQFNTSRLRRLYKEYNYK
jgi:hypothetical protein